jgi:hypothetical protein
MQHHLKVHPMKFGKNGPSSSIPGTGKPAIC